MEKVMNNIIDLCSDLELDERKTEKEVIKLFKNYRIAKEKQKIIRERYKAALSSDNLSSMGTIKSDPTGNKVEQIARYDAFINKIDEIYKLFSQNLTKDEKVIYKKTLETHHSHESVQEELSIASSSTYYIRKRSCYLKVAMWFDLEVYKK